MIITCAAWQATTVRTREAIDEALSLFYKTIELDPRFASAYGMAAWCYAWRKINGWMTDRVKEIAETERLARQAAEFGPEDAVALSRSAHALAFVVGDLDAAASFVDRALVLNPNVAGAWYASGWIRVWLGEPDLAIAHMATGMRLSPRDPHMIGMQGGNCFRAFYRGPLRRSGGLGRESHVGAVKLFDHTTCCCGK